MGPDQVLQVIAALGDWFDKAKCEEEGALMDATLTCFASRLGVNDEEIARLAGLDAPQEDYYAEPLDDSPIESTPVSSDVEVGPEPSTPLDKVFELSQVAEEIGGPVADMARNLKEAIPAVVKALRESTKTGTDVVSSEDEEDELDEPDDGDEPMSDFSDDDEEFYTE